MYVGSTITLSDATGGGVWSSAHTTLATVGSTGIVTGVAAGTDTIRYAVTNICGTAVAPWTITVNPLATAGTISGDTLVCVGTPVTLTDAATDGVWISSNTAVATVGTGTGVVTGVTAGTATISYSVTNMCNTANALYPVTVNTLPSAGTIAGIDSVCPGDSITLSDGATGGTWSASNTNATVSAAGVVTGVTTGAVTITYSVTNSCGSTNAIKSVTIRQNNICREGVQPSPVVSAEIKVYPNPSVGTFTVELPQTNGDAVITIMDVLGKVIATRTVAGNVQKTVFRLNVAPGSYLVKVEADGRTYRNKVTVW